MSGLTLTVPVQIPQLGALPGNTQSSDLIVVYRPSTQTVYGATLSQFDSQLLASNNVWTGANIYNGPSTFNGSVTLNGAVTFVGTVSFSSVAITGGTIDNTAIGNATPSTGKFTTLQASGQITATVITGTAPFVVTSTTRVVNLNVATAGNADTVTTNANLTGPITSVGNATSIASQTGTGTKFVVDTSPTIVTPTISGHFTAEGVTTTGATGTGNLVFATTPSFTSSLTAGSNGGTGGSIVLNGATSGSATVRVAAAAGTATIFQLPVTNGSSTNVLQTDGTGVTSWVAPNIAAGVTLPSYFATISTQSGTTYTLASTDSGTIIQFTSGSAVTVTLPNNLAVGTVIGVLQIGAGQVTFSAAAGAAFHNAHSYTKTFGQYAAVSLSVYSNAGGTSAIYALVGDGA